MNDLIDRFAVTISKLHLARSQPAFWGDEGLAQKYENEGKPATAEFMRASRDQDNSHLADHAQFKNKQSLITVGSGPNRRAGDNRMTVHVYQPPDAFPFASAELIMPNGRVGQFTSNLDLVKRVMAEHGATEGELGEIQKYIPETEFDYRPNQMLPEDYHMSAAGQPIRMSKTARELSLEADGLQMLAYGHEPNDQSELNKILDDYETNPDEARKQHTDIAEQCDTDAKNCRKKRLFDKAKLHEAARDAHLAAAMAYTQAPTPDWRPPEVMPEDYHMSSAGQPLRLAKIAAALARPLQRQGEPIRMTKHEDFHEEMSRDPDNKDTPLVYADWLEEHNNMPETANAIRRELTPGANRKVENHEHPVTEHRFYDYSPNGFVFGLLRRDEQKKPFATLVMHNLVDPYKARARAQGIDPKNSLYSDKIKGPFLTFPMKLDTDDLPFAKRVLLEHGHKEEDLAPLTEAIAKQGQHELPPVNLARIGECLRGITEVPVKFMNADFINEISRTRVPGSSVLPSESSKTPALIYADWLEENNKPWTAALIRHHYNGAGSIDPEMSNITTLPEHQIEGDRPHPARGSGSLHAAGWLERFRPYADPKQPYKPSAEINLYAYPGPLPNGGLPNGFVLGSHKTQDHNFVRGIMEEHGASPESLAKIDQHFGVKPQKFDRQESPSLNLTRAGDLLRMMSLFRSVHEQKNPISFEDAGRMLGGKPSLMLERNTYLHRLDPDTYAVRLHGTDIVRIHRNGKYTLHSGGYNTATTANRMAIYSPADVSWGRVKGITVYGKPFEEGKEINDYLPDLPQAPEQDWRPQEMILEDYHAANRPGQPVRMANQPMSPLEATKVAAQATGVLVNRQQNRAGAHHARNALQSASEGNSEAAIRWHKKAAEWHRDVGNSLRVMADEYIPENRHLADRDRQLAKDHEDASFAHLAAAQSHSGNGEADVRPMEMLPEDYHMRRLGEVLRLASFFDPPPAQKPPNLTKIPVQRVLGGELTDDHIHVGLNGSKLAIHTGPKNMFGVGKKVDLYDIAPASESEGGKGFAVTEEPKKNIWGYSVMGGRAPNAYTTTISKTSPREDKCSCPGGSFRGYCKHIAALRGLAEQGKLPGVEPSTTASAEPPSAPSFTPPTPGKIVQPDESRREIKLDDIRRGVDDQLAGTRLAYHLRQIEQEHSTGRPEDQKIAILAKAALEGHGSLHGIPDTYAALGEALRANGKENWANAYRWHRMKYGLITDRKIAVALKNPKLDEFLGKVIKKGDKTMFLRTMARLAMSDPAKQSDADQRLWAHPAMQHVWKSLKKHTGVGNRPGADRIVAQSVLRHLFRAEDRRESSMSRSASGRVPASPSQGLPARSKHSWQELFEMLPAFLRKNAKRDTSNPERFRAGDPVRLANQPMSPLELSTAAFGASTRTPDQSGHAKTALEHALAGNSVDASKSHMIAADHHEQQAKYWRERFRVENATYNREMNLKARDAHILAALAHSTHEPEERPGEILPEDYHMRRPGDPLRFVKLTSEEAKELKRRFGITLDDLAHMNPEVKDVHPQRQRQEPAPQPAAEPMPIQPPMPMQPPPVAAPQPNSSVKQKLLRHIKGIKKEVFRIPEPKKAPRQAAAPIQARPITPAQQLPPAPVPKSLDPSQRTQPPPNVIVKQYTPGLQPPTGVHQAVFHPPGRVEPHYHNVIRKSDGSIAATFSGASPEEAQARAQRHVDLHNSLARLAKRARTNAAGRFEQMAPKDRNRMIWYHPANVDLRQQALTHLHDLRTNAGVPIHGKPFGLELHGTGLKMQRRQLLEQLSRVGNVLRMANQPSASALELSKKANDLTNLAERNGLHSSRMAVEYAGQGDSIGAVQAHRDAADFHQQSALIQREKLKNDPSALDQSRREKIETNEAAADAHLTAALAHSTHEQDYRPSEMLPEDYHMFRPGGGVRLQRNGLLAKLAQIAGPLRLVQEEVNPWAQTRPALQPRQTPPNANMTTVGQPKPSGSTMAPPLMSTHLMDLFQLGSHLRRTGVAALNPKLSSHKTLLNVVARNPEYHVAHVNNHSGAPIASYVSFDRSKADGLADQHSQLRDMAHHAALNAGIGWMPDDHAEAQKVWSHPNNTELNTKANGVLNNMRKSLGHQDLGDGQHEQSGMPLASTGVKLDRSGSPLRFANDTGNDRLRSLVDKLRSVLAETKNDPETDPNLTADAAAKISRAKQVMYTPGMKAPTEPFDESGQPALPWLKSPEKVDLSNQEQSDISRFFGKPISRDDFLRAASHVDGNRLDVKLTQHPWMDQNFQSPNQEELQRAGWDGSPVLMTQSYHPDARGRGTQGEHLYSNRVFYRDKDGNLHVYNNYLTMGKRAFAAGLSGRAITRAQIEALRRLGAVRIHSQLEHNPRSPIGFVPKREFRSNPDPDQPAHWDRIGFVGGKIWPMFGYGGSLSPWTIPEIPEDIRQHMKGRDVRDLLDAPGGKEWWAQHPETIYNGYMDLDPESRTGKAHDQAWAEMQSKTKPEGDNGPRGTSEALQRDAGSSGGAIRLGMEQEAIAAGENAAAQGVGGDVPSGAVRFSAGTDSLKEIAAAIQAGKRVSLTVAQRRDFEEMLRGLEILMEDQKKRGIAPQPDEIQKKHDLNVILNYAPGALVLRRGQPERMASQSTSALALSKKARRLSYRANQEAKLSPEMALASAEKGASLEAARHHRDSAADHERFATNMRAHAATVSKMDRESMLGSAAAHEAARDAHLVAALAHSTYEPDTRPPDVLPEDYHMQASGASLKLTRPGWPDASSDLASALQRMKTANHQSYVTAIGSAFKAMALDPHKIQAVLHNESGVTQPAVAAAVSRPTDPASALYAAAWMGQLGHQTGVLAFQSHPQGPDSIYQMKLPGSGQAIANAFDAAGIPQRVMIPQADGFQVVVHDPGRQLRGNVASVARQFGTMVGETRGHGQVIGGDDPQEARAKYRDIIGKFEGNQKLQGAAS